MELKTFQVDSFTNRPFLGNPAAVCLLDTEIESRVMQAIASEMNLSETAFVYPVSEDGSRRLRWFTPAMEVPLCGHATLASARVLFDHDSTVSPLRFRTLSGELTVHREDDGRLRMDFPAAESVVKQAPAGLLEVFGLPQETVCRESPQVWLIRLDREEQVAALDPDFRALGEVDLGGQAIGLVVTAPSSDPAVDIVSRFFAPWAGIDEDPVTGLGHTVLGPYWATALDRTRFRARQISQRPGEMDVRLDGDRVHLTGEAVTVLQGMIVLP